MSVFVISRRLWNSFPTRMNIVWEFCVFFNHIKNRNIYFILICNSIKDSHLWFQSMWYTSFSFYYNANDSHTELWKMVSVLSAVHFCHKLYRFTCTMSIHIWTWTYSCVLSFMIFIVYRLESINHPENECQKRDPIIFHHDWVESWFVAA